MYCLKGTLKSCKEIKNSYWSAVSGIYEVEIEGEKVELYCDMDTSLGGWTVSIKIYEYFY